MLKEEHGIIVFKAHTCNLHTFSQLEDVHCVINPVSMGELSSLSLKYNPLFYIELNI